MRYDHKGKRPKCHMITAETGAHSVSHDHTWYSVTWTQLEKHQLVTKEIKIHVFLPLPGQIQPGVLLKAA